MCSVYLCWLREAVSAKQSSTCAFHLLRKEKIAAAMAFLSEQTQLVTVLRHKVGAGQDLLPRLI